MNKTGQRFLKLITCCGLCGDAVVRRRQVMSGLGDGTPRATLLKQLRIVGWQQADSWQVALLVKL
jgi:hypothetical protein